MNVHPMPPPPPGYIWAFDARNIFLFEDLAEIKNLRTCVGTPQGNKYRGFYIYFSDLIRLAQFLKERGFGKQARSVEKAYRKDKKNRNKPELAISEKLRSKRVKNETIGRI